MRAVLLLGLVAESGLVLAGEDAPFPRTQPDAIYCPIISPLTEVVRGGFVVLEFTVQPDGSVTNVRIVDSAPDRKWETLAAKSVSTWRFKPRQEPSHRTQMLIFEFE